jgi:hypothetical protein
METFGRRNNEYVPAQRHVHHVVSSLDAIFSLQAGFRVS